MESIAVFFSEANFLFTSVGLLGAVLLATQLLGIGHGDSDVSHDVNVDHEVDVSHDVGHEVAHDVDHSAGPDHEVSHDADHTQETETRGEFSLAAFIGLGLGPPSSLIFMILFLSFGLLGLGLNRLVASVFDVWAVYLPINAFLAMIGSVGLLHVIIPQLAKFSSGRPMTAYRLEEGTGKVGECTMKIDGRGSRGIECRGTFCRSEPVWHRAAG